MSSAHRVSFRLRAVPDAASPLARLKAGGDVRAAAWDAAVHTLRMVVDSEPSSVRQALRFSYNHAAAHPQERLTIELTGQAERVEAAALGLLLERGPLQEVYALEPADPSPVDWSRFGASCDVVRRQMLLAASVTAEFNPKALPAYYLITPFAPREDNDYLWLDSILDRLDQPALIEIAVEPVDIAPQLALHTRYLASLQQINHFWEGDEEEAGAPADIKGDHGRARLRPLRRKDLIVEEISRSERRVQEILTQPHLRFHIRVFAQDQHLARLLASVVAESAFADGAYQLCDSAPGEPLFDAAIKAYPGVQVITVPAQDALLGRRGLPLYDRLAALGNLASVNELTGAFRLPMAAQASPYCIRKDTDPPVEDPADLIVVGHDARRAAAGMDHGGRPYGIRLQNLVKHLFVGGLPGNGKTLVAFHIAAQLTERGIPVLILEPAKSEYRLLKQLRNSPLDHVRRLAEKLQVYTPGSPISPLRFNPLRIPEGIGRDEHIEDLLACFKAALPMEGSMLGLLGEALERVYDD